MFIDLGRNPRQAAGRVLVVCLATSVLMFGAGSHSFPAVCAAGAEESGAAVPAQLDADAFTELTQAFGLERTAERAERWASNCPPGTVSRWEQLPAAAAALGIRLESRQVPLERWPDLPGPLIAAERDPPGWAVYLLRSKYAVQRFRHGNIETLSWTEVAERYAGRVLRRAEIPRAAILDIQEFHARITCRSPDDQVQQVFRLGNLGRETLGIRVLGTSCACTAANATSQAIQPRGSGTVDVAVRAQGVGTARHRVLLATSDPYWPRVTLTVELTTPQPVSLYPERLFLSSFGEPLEAEVTLAAPGQAKLGGMETTAAWLEAHATPERELAEMSQWSLHLRVRPETVPGEHRADVLVELATPKTAIARLPVTVRRFAAGTAGDFRPTPLPSPPRPRLRLLYTADLRGHLVPCDCTPGQLGGLHRLSTLVSRLRASAEQTFLLDGGGAFEPADKADVVADVFALLRYDACSPWASDLDPRADVWRRALERRRVPVPAAEDDTQATPRGLVLGGSELGVVVVTASDLSSAGRDEAAAARMCLALLDRVRVLAVLSRLGVLGDVRLARRLAEQARPVIVFGGTENASLTEPLRVGPVLLPPVGDRGMYVTRVDFAGRGTADLQPALVERLPVDPQLEPDPKVAALIGRYYDAQKRQLAKTAGATSHASEAASCAECHAEAVAAWRRSRHARALLTLQRKDRLVAECARCHSTPFLATGSLPPADADLLDYGVSCAACHVRGPAHALDPGRVRTVAATSREDCLVCHSPEQQIQDFRYERALETIRHWASRP